MNKKLTTRKPGPALFAGCLALLSAAVFPVWGKDVPPDAATRRVLGAKMHYASWCNDYCHSAVYKIFLKNKTEKRVLTTLDQAMNWIRATRDLTGGMHQIVYLVGWQHEGHDSKFPDFSTVGPQCCSSFSQDPRESLRAFMRAARSFHADVSLHINMDDAYTNSPLWKTYMENDLLCRNKDGSLCRGGVWGGEASTPVSHLKEWRKGFARKRIMDLLTLLPELRDSHTIHIDALAGRESPYEGISARDDVEGIRAIVDFWHEQGIDVTCEFLPDYDQIGYFPFVYHYNVDERSKILYPPDLLCGGAGWNVRNDVDYYNKIWRGMMPGMGCVYEEAWGIAHFGDRMGDLHDRAVFARRLFKTMILYAYYNTSRPVKHTIDLAHYTVEHANGVTASIRLRDRALTVTDNGRTVVSDGDYFLDFTRDGARILAFSTKGCDRTFALPATYRDARALEGTKYPAGSPFHADVQDHAVRLTLQPGESLILNKFL